MMSCLCVALGGAIGSVLRYLIGLIKIEESIVFPYKTLAINIIGSFLIGIVVALTMKKVDLNPDLVLFFKVGICGGFTTFSTFALESVNLFQSGKILVSLLYIVLSVTLSVCAIFLAQKIV
ncbi:MAG: fluoride efflux transporter CrcB [Oscillospiraceae bacterium]|nr:fluoride efflux transporter CrcB [Candidatus Ruminococcus equi]